MPNDVPPPGVKRPTDGRAYLGLAVLGWGLSILLGVTPHEDRIVGAALATFGAVLVGTARSLPRVGHLSPWLVAGSGLAIAGLVLGYDAWFGAAMDVPKAAMVVFGLGLAAASPWLERTVRLRRGATTTVGGLVACALPVFGAPLAVWGVQALFKTAVGATPVEAFLRIGLLAPLGVILGVLGMHPAVQGQMLTFVTPRGPLTVEVGAACSGIQAMALFSGVLALYMAVERPGGRRLALWCCIGIAGVYVANLLRLVLLFLVGYQWGLDVMLQAHAQAGWIVFVAWALLFARMARTTRHSPS